MIAIGERHGAQWYTAGRRSVKGHPHHPLYLKATSRWTRSTSAPTVPNACRRNRKNVRPLGEPGHFFYVPRGGHFLLAMSFTTSMTAPKSTPATAQMNQLYFGCPLPMGPKV